MLCNLKGCLLNVLLKLSSFSKCYLQEYVYFCVCVRVCVCGVLITSSHTCFPRRLSLPSSDASSSKPDPATVVASLSLHVLPSPCLAALALIQQPVLVLYYCVVQTVRPCWYHTNPGRKIHVAWRMYMQVL